MIFVLSCSSAYKEDNKVKIIIMQNVSRENNKTRNKTRKVTGQTNNSYRHVLSY